MNAPIPGRACNLVLYYRQHRYLSVRVHGYADASGRRCVLIPLDVVGLMIFHLARLIPVTKKIRKRYWLESCMRCMWHSRQRNASHILPSVLWKANILPIVCRFSICLTSVACIRFLVTYVRRIAISDLGVPYSHTACTRKFPLLIGCGHIKVMRLHFLFVIFSSLSYNSPYVHLTYIHLIF